MFHKILVANRGEIAVRIIRACRELGIYTVAVYSEADRDALHVTLADEAYCIGPAAVRDSYLNFANIMSVATLTEADAIHPGYGFLAENSNFADICAECNIKFIGPSAQAIQTMGAKSTAKETMKRAGVPVIPGSDGVIENESDALQIAEEIGYPVLVKATAGGGGKGIRTVCYPDELPEAIQMARQEADGQPVDVGEQDAVRRRAPRGFNGLPVHIPQGGHVVEPAPADDAEHGLGHLEALQGAVC